MADEGALGADRAAFDAPSFARIAYAFDGVRRTVFLAAAILLGASTSARAEPRSLRIDYEAARACPDARRFVELARDRIEPWASLDERGELVARVRAEAQGGSFVGRMSLEDAAGKSFGSRTIQEADCEDVVLALALFLAVALEADASHARAAPEASEAPASVETRPPADVPAPERRHAPPPRDEAPPMRWDLLARGHVVVGRLPSAAPGVALAVDVGPRKRWSLLRPFGSLGVDLAPYSRRDEGRGHVELGWGAAFARACAAFDVTGSSTSDPWIEPWLCARVDVGGIRAASRGYAVNRTEVLPAHAAGGEAGVAVRLSQALSLGAFVHAMAPIVRNELVLGENRVFRAPIVAGEAGVELRVEIW